MNFLFNVGPVSGAIHIDDFDGDANGDGDTDDSQEGLNIEQAHFTYSLDNGVSFTFGRTVLPSVLSVKIQLVSTPSAVLMVTILDYNLVMLIIKVVEGLAVSYAGDADSLAVSIRRGWCQGSTDDDLDLEIAITYTGLENVTIVTLDISSTTKATMLRS